MATFAITAMGRDRPGIVAALTQVLVGHDVNIEDAEMAILRGHFTLMLVVAAPPEVDAADLREDLATVARELPLESVALSAVESLEADAPVPTHAISVYGSDRPGIVHAVAAELAARDANVVDLKTRLLPDGLYVMLVEASVPPAAQGTIEDALAAVGARLGVNVSVRPLDADVL